ncbi:hypothetical protein Hanom_Chr16g01424641 [Helianthus anomalus]
MKSYISCTSNPILLSRFTRSVDDKFTSACIVSSDRFNASNLKNNSRSNILRLCDTFNLKNQLTLTTYIAAMS